MTTTVIDQAIPWMTHNDLAETTRSRIVTLLNRRLADAVDLATQLKVAHWNVKGANFIGLHKLFDEVHADVAGYADLIAERVVQLGGIAEGTARMAGERSELREYPTGVLPGDSHVDAVSIALAAFTARTRKAIDLSAEAGDQATADIFTEITRGADKWLWFVEAHRQEP